MGAAISACGAAQSPGPATGTGSAGEPPRRPRWSRRCLAADPFPCACPRTRPPSATPADAAHVVGCHGRDPLRAPRAPEGDGTVPDTPGGREARRAGAIARTLESGAGRAAVQAPPNDHDGGPCRRYAGARDHRIVSDRTIDSHIKKLRHKLAGLVPGFDLIHSVYGVGYHYGEREAAASDRRPMPVITRHF